MTPIPPLEDPLITSEEFARLACISRRQIDRLRSQRANGFPREFEMGNGHSKYRRCPRFKLSEVSVNDLIASMPAEFVV
jgi:predicted DNA-binding transcriptional regulator AlpA